MSDKFKRNRESPDSDFLDLLISNITENVESSGEKDGNYPDARKSVDIPQSVGCK